MNQHDMENTDWGKSVAGVVFREGKVLLARHTYGGGKGRLIIPGGYISRGESPEDALKREYMEETGIAVEAEKIIGIRFNQKDWYVAFRAEYLSGEEHSDGDENSEVLWMGTDEALSREDVPDLTKKLIACALSGNGMQKTDYNGTTRYGEYSFYGAKKAED